ncbi:MAG: YegS/Rv2252/BmrU family lipid kinase [Clostridiales bacterium]|jgi:YegS/Rv2252/BmrU family lipid kinase|nr:YegS/Rv2252/BmrU family lipid kinase [Clostridiales bacterium]
MKKVKLIYNPNAGDKGFKLSLDACVTAFQNAGYETHLFRMHTGLDLETLADGLNEYDMLAVSGGDGTVNQVLNVILPRDISIPLAIIPSGTANDFASYLKIPVDPEDAVTALVNGELTYCDAGLVNGRYFINVCGSGVFVNISEMVDEEAKDTLGKYAYYLKGVEQFSSCVPFRIRVKTQTRVFEEDVFMYFILNSAGVGGFNNISAQASIQDGLFEFIAVKAVPVMDLAVLFLKVIKGDFLEDNRVIVIKEPYFHIEYLSEDKQFLTTGVDGEKGPEMPVEVKNLHRKIKLIVPKEG